MASRQEFLQELLEAHGVPGAEQDVWKVMEKRLKGVGAISRDRLGSFICEKKGSAAGPRVMLAGHLDEVGFMVKSVTKEGFIRFLPLGGWWGHVVLGQRMIVRTRKGDIVGVVGSKPPHEIREEDRKKVLEVREMYIDVGATHDWDPRKKLDIRPGDPIIPWSPYTVMANPDLILAKAWDNRLGCGIAAEVALALKGPAHPNTLYAVATVQEEVGLRGARVAAYRVEPDAAIALEGTICDDLPQPADEDRSPVTRLGDGPALTLMDSSLVSHPGLLRLLQETAAAAGIGIQYKAPGLGGTDSGAIHLTRAGVPAITVAVPCRYIHTPAAVLNLNDLENTVRLVAATLRRIDRNDVTRSA